MFPDRPEMFQPVPLLARRGVTLALGLFLLLTGLGKMVGAGMFCVMMSQSDRDGGLFGFRFGGVLIILVGVPLAVGGALDTAAGIASALRRPWGYILGIVSGIVSALCYLLPFVAMIMSAFSAERDPDTSGFAAGVFFLLVCIAGNLMLAWAFKQAWSRRH